jgi:hypothetical protein
MAPCQNYIHVQASTATVNNNTGIQSAITNGTPVPPPQVRTTPLDGGGPTEQQKTDGRLAAARSDSNNNDPRSGGRTAAAQASGWALLQSCPRPRRRSRGEDKYKEPEARGADGGGDPIGDGDFSSRLRLGTNAQAISPPAEPHSNPPGRVGHRPPRGGAMPVQRQDHPRTRTPP